MATSASDTSTGPRRVQRVPATFGQQRLWFMEQLQPGSVAYLGAWSIRLSGELRVDVLEETLNEIVRRHKIFRTTFAGADGDVVQMIAPALRIPLPLFDVSGERDPEADAGRIAREETERPLDLAHGPLLRTTLIRLSATEHIFLFTLHHIIFDGWSRAIFVRELSAIYEALREGSPSPLSDPRVQYADYAVWQRKTLKGERFEKLLNYWKKQLADAPAVLTLPTDRPRPAVESFRGATKYFELPGHLSGKLNALARRRGASMFMVLMAAFQALLARYSGQDDILVGIPVAGRTHTEFESIIGYFANQLVLRLKFAGDPTFDELIDQMKDVSFGAFEHQEMPLDRLVQELNPERTLSYNPLFQTLFSLRNYQKEELKLAGLARVEFGENAGESSKFDLSMLLTEEGEKLSGWVEYNVDLFDEVTIERMLGHYTVLLEAVAENAARRVSELSLLTQRERQQMASWDGAVMERPHACLHTLFEQQVERTPDAVACIAGDARVSYGELNARANRVAHYIRTLGAGPDVLVGIFCERTLDMLAAILGTLKAGSAYVPLDLGYPKERLSNILEDARARLVLTQTALVDRLPAFAGDVVCVDALAGGADSNPEVEVSEADLAYVLFTSGSTGRPKGVALEHRNCSNFVHWCLQSFSAEELAGVLFGTSIGFDMSTFEMFVTLAAGGRLVLVENALMLSSAPAREDVTLINTVPSVMAELVRSGGLPLSVKTLLLAGEALSDALAAEIFADTKVTKLVNSYGPTESGYATWEIVERGRRVTIGRPLANFQAHILDARGNAQPAGIPGELFLAGAGLARGYMNRDDLTAERFLSNPFKPGMRMYKTGDLCRWLADGRIEYMGRIDDQVKIRGFRVEPSEIELVLRSDASVLDCVVLAREDVPGDKRLIAYVVAQADARVDAVALRALVKSRLPEYMVPAGFHVIDKLPLSPNGKVDRRALPAPELEQSESSAVAPSTPTEELVAAIWAEVLRRTKVGVEDDFFELGGHSLLATQVISRVAQAFEVNVALRCLFEDPTVRGIAAEVDKLRAGGAKSTLPPLVRVDRNAALPLSFAQQRFWLLNQLNPEDTGYNVKTAMRIGGPLDSRVLERCLAQLLARNEALRTTYSVADGVPTQVIRPAGSVALQVIDIEEGGEGEALRQAAVAAAKPFQLSTGPVCRFLLYRLAAEDHVLVMASHHICMDGTSSAILFEDLAALYAQAASGEEPHLSPLRFDYADFAAWQRDWMRGEVLEEHLVFWRKHLEGLPPFLDVPGDREVHTVSTAGELRSTGMAAGFMEQLTKLCQAQKVTQFTVMLWALAIVLERWSGQGSFAIGTVAGNRPLADLDRVVGCFLNMLPLRVDVGAGESALDVLKRTRTTVLDGFSHGQCPFEAVVDAMKVERTAHRNPIFNVGMLLQNFSEITFRTDTLSGRAIPFARETALLDLRFVVSIHDEKVVLACEYKQELFEAQTIDLLLKAYSQALQKLVIEPATKVDAVVIPEALSAQAEKARGRGSKKLIVSATFTAEPIEEPLNFWMRELEMDYKIEFAPYNQVFQNLLDPGSSLRRNNGGFNVLLVRFEDWQQFKGADVASAKDGIRRNVEELISAARAAAATNLATYIVCCCPPSRALANDPDWAAFLLEMEEHVAGQLGATGGVHVITSSRIAGLYPVAEYEDKYAEAIGHVPYTKEFFTALATVVTRWVWGLSGPGFKVIALDCDNTLWRGICGEDGPRGVKIGAPYLALQEFVRTQREQGMLLCLCSKNNERDVWAVFEQNPGMLLKRDEITAHRINWERKSQSLKGLAQELKLGLDSFVFIDDNPVECAEVEAECPEVLTLQVPEEIEQLPELLKHVWAFDHFRSTEVDRRRGELYKDNQQREELRQGQSLEAFIDSLQLEIAIKPLAEETVARVAQLTQRTNQFNFTTVRRQDGQVRELMHAPAMGCLTVDLRDRFGDYGLIGVVIYGFDESSLVVDTFLMSCRALGRRVEHTLLERLGEEARERGLEWVDLQFSPTAKNAPAMEFLESLEGAAKIAGDGVVTYRLPAARIAETRANKLAAVV